MSTPDPALPRPTAPVWSFRFLIATKNSGSPFITMNPRLPAKFDELHRVKTYVCADAAEYARHLDKIVATTDKRCYGIVELYNAATGERRKIDGTEQLVIANAPTTAWQRLLMENAELLERILKLKDFITENPNYSKLSSESQTLMRQQLVTMQEYSRILDRRTALWLEALNAPDKFSQQDGQEVSRLAHTQESAGSNPAPATIPQTDEGTQSGGEQSPVVPESTLSPAPLDADAGTRAAEEDTPDTSPPTTGENGGGDATLEPAEVTSARAPVAPKEKRKAGRPAKK